MAQQSPPLSKAALAHLRGQAHHLKPIVAVGKEGCTDSVIAAIAQALLDHELIKVRLYKPEDKAGAAQEIAAKSESTLCGIVGHTLILYKKHPEKPLFKLPQDEE